MSKMVSIIIPTRNEEKFIRDVLDNIVAQDYDPNRIEVFIVDGQSTDRTVDIIDDFTKLHANFHLMNNPERVVPFALNYGLSKCKGDVIIRLDAHSIYPHNYISKLVEVLESYNADNVGGRWITTPANNTVEARAIALATSHKFGIGDASYRLESDKIKEVDTVPFGCYKKEVFDKIGTFDIDLIRNQDDEFNARLKKHGGKILLVPDIGITYFARAKMGKMMKMFYQYGLFKPLVNSKVGSPATLRQLVPPLFVLFLLMGLFLAFAGGLLYKIWFILLAFYFFVSLLVSMRITIKEKSAGLFLLLPVTFFLIHLSYGWGYLYGALKLHLFKQKPGGTHFATSR